MNLEPSDVIDVVVVQTVTGPVPPELLGRVLMHEHVSICSPGLHGDYPGTYPRADVLAAAIEGLSALKDAGIDTLVDHTTYDLGRDIELLAEASGASGVNIVAATGVWIEPQRYWQLRSPVEAAELFISDLEQGIGGTDIRAGVIKCATDAAGVTPSVERVLRACAIAHRATGVYLSTHTHAPGRSGIEQQRIFSEEGVDLTRVVIGHSGDTTDLGYLRSLIKPGSFVGMDRFGAEDRLPDRDRVDAVLALWRDGSVDQVLLSQDATFWSDRQPMDSIRRARPHWHHRHVVEDIVPTLLAAGVSAVDVEQMLIHSPRKLLTPSAPYPGSATAAARRNGWN
jgi:phosphotriesterase-related protein